MRDTLSLLAALLLTALLPAKPVELDPFVVNPNRIIADGSKRLSFVSKIELQNTTSGDFRDVSDALNSYPGFASFRRTHPTSAHPTTQGARLRNFGSNASSRALLLYDGVPQNDPFGGWIYWHRFDLSRIESITLYPSGVGEIWGNMASGGLLSIVSEAPTPGSQLAQISFGSSNRLDLRAKTANQLTKNAVFDIGLRRFQSDGFHTLHPAQRGDVDRRASSEATSVSARLSWKNGDAWQSQLSLNALDEKRGNGTLVAVNDTQAFDLSYISERRLPSQNGRLNLNLYFQDRDFQNVFASVAATRESERPALDQYKVPARSLGGALVYRQEGENPLRFTGGLDFRLIEGSVNERFRNLGAGFTRERRAGGEQAFYGLFGGLNYQASENDQISTTLRIEHLARRNGLRVETNTETNATIRNDRYPSLSSEILSGNLNWRHSFTDTLASNLSIFSGYRAPTLNELYRPFRVRNDITEANPTLANERHQGIEFSLSSEATNDTASKHPLSLKASAFHYEANEMVANALITTESGFNPDFGFIPNGGSGSRRVNLDQSSVSGFEIHASQKINESWNASLTAVYSRTEIDRDELSQLAGNAFPQSSPWKAVANLNYDAHGRLSFSASYRWYDRSWENLANTRRLGATSDLRLSANFKIDSNHSVSANLTNALDEQNISGISSNGLITIDEPRSLLITYTWQK